MRILGPFGLSGASNDQGLAFARAKAMLAVHLEVYYLYHSTGTRGMSAPLLPSFKWPFCKATARFDSCHNPTILWHAPQYGHPDSTCRGQNTLKPLRQGWVAWSPLLHSLQASVRKARLYHLYSHASLVVLDSTWTIRAICRLC